MAMADVMMVGRFGTRPLAELALGYAVFIPIFVAGVGCQVGIISITARGLGAGGPTCRAPCAGCAGRCWSAASRPVCLAAGRCCA